MTLTFGKNTISVRLKLSHFVIGIMFFSLFTSTASAKPQTTIHQSKLSPAHIQKFVGQFTEVQRTIWQPFIQNPPRNLTEFEERSKESLDVKLPILLPWHKTFVIRARRQLDEIESIYLRFQKNNNETSQGASLSADFFLLFNQLRARVERLDRLTHQGLTYKNYLLVADMALHISTTVENLLGGYGKLYGTSAAVAEIQEILKHLDQIESTRFNQNDDQNNETGDFPDFFGSIPVERNSDWQQDLKIPTFGLLPKIFLPKGLKEVHVLTWWVLNASSPENAANSKVADNVKRDPLEHQDHDLQHEEIRTEILIPLKNYLTILPEPNQPEWTKEDAKKALIQLLNQLERAQAIRVQRMIDFLVHRQNFTNRQEQEHEDLKFFEIDHELQPLFRSKVLSRGTSEFSFVTKAWQALPNCQWILSSEGKIQVVESKRH